MRANPELVLWPVNPSWFNRFQQNNSTVVENAWFYVSTEGWFRKRRDYSSINTSNFKALARQRKQLPVNPYSSHSSWWDGTPYTYRLYGTNNVGTVTVRRHTYHSVYHFNPYFPRAQHVASVQQVARSRAAKDASGLSVNLAQAFGERKQTANLITNTIWRIANAARSLRRADLISCFHYLSISKPPSASLTRRVVKTPAKDRVANFWLELQYGWKPLLQDVHDAAETLAKHIETDPWHSKITGSARGSEVRFNFTKSDFPVSKGSQTDDTSAKFTLYMRLDSKSRSILAQTGISNPALLAWELLPYSFVVDWFIPVGNYLQSLNEFDGWIFVQGYLNQRTKMKYFRTWQRDVHTITNDSYQSVYLESYTGQATAESFLFSREVITAFPQANFPKLRSLDEALSPTHALNGLALLTSLFSRR